MYDITNYSSFENLDDWFEKVRDVFAKDDQNRLPPHMALVGNKIDLQHQRTVRPDKHEKMCQDKSMSSHFVSAKSGDSVSLCFLRVAAEICGVKLSASELDQHRQVVAASIQRDTNDDRRAGGDIRPAIQSRAPQELSNREFRAENSASAMSAGGNQEQSKACCILWTERHGNNTPNDNENQS